MFLIIISLKLSLLLIMDYVGKSRSGFSFRWFFFNSTLLAVSTLSEVISNYIDEGSTIYACFLDIGKALERINHSLILQKLKNSSLPK